MRLVTPPLQVVAMDLQQGTATTPVPWSGPNSNGSSEIEVAAEDKSLHGRSRTVPAELPSQASPHSPQARQQYTFHHSDHRRVHTPTANSRRPPRTPLTPNSSASSLVGRPAAVPRLTPHRLSASRESSSSAVSDGSTAGSENTELSKHAGYHEDTARRPIYSSGSLPDTFRTGFSTAQPPQVGDFTRLPRGLSRTRLAHAYQRFPYGMVAHRAAS